MAKENSRAIQLLDANNPRLAGKVFKHNYKRFPSPTTAINYSNFLLDEHYIQSPSVLYESIKLFRSVHSKHILRKIKTDQKTPQTIKYHLACVNGQAQIKTNHLQKAKVYYEEAYQVNSTSIEAIAMLAWISFLEKQYSLLQQYLGELADVLQLGTDIEKNLDIIFDKCPFVFFPYYQLQVVAYYGTNEKEKAGALLKKMQTLSKDKKLFSANDIVLLSTYLGEFQDIGPFFEQYIYLNNGNQDELYYILYGLKSFLHCCDNISEYYFQIRRSTSVIGRIWFRLKICVFNESIRDIMCQNHRSHVSYKECHFIGCPVHNQWNTVN